MSNQRTIIFAILCFALAVRAVAFFLPHVENDEVIYRTLAEKLTLQPADYSLQGTALLKQLPAAQYDYPIFRHPPVFFYLLALIYRILGVSWGMLLPVTSGLLCIYLGWLIGRRLFTEQEALLAALIMAGCPIMLLTSARLWIDTTSVMFMTLALYLFICGCEPARKNYLYLCGISLAAGILSKYSAAGILPAMAAFAFMKTAQPKTALRNLGTVLGVCLLCLAPWFLWYASAMGGFSYSAHFRPTDEYLEMFPFVKRSFQQPWHAYFWKLALNVPVFLFALITLRKGKRSQETAVLWWWALAFILGFALLLKLRILGCALRYLLPASIPLSLLAARGLTAARRDLLAVVIILLAYQLLSGILNAFIFYNADVFSIIR